MVAAQGPAGPRRRLGAELRRLRSKAGLNLEDVAEQLDCSTSKISRLETGKGIPKLPDIRELIRIYGVSSDTERDMLLRLVKDSREQGWWEPYTEGVHPERFVMDAPARYPALETDAIAVRSFDMATLHGLLQTRSYATAVVSAVLPHHQPREIEQLVDLRIRRQQALCRDRPLQLSVVLDEAVLQRMVGGPAVMAEQLQALVDVSRLSMVSIQVLRLDAGLHRAHAGQFVILEFPEFVGPDVVYIEGHAGDTYLENESDVVLYKNVFADVADRALDSKESRRLIGFYLRKYAPPGKVGP